MDDRTYLFQYIRQRTSAYNAAHPVTMYRDAHDYFSTKRILCHPPGSTTDSALVMAALEVCGLDYRPGTNTVLHQPENALRAAVAAAVLATSIISAPSPLKLEWLRKGLTRAGIHRAHQELRHVLTYGDVKTVHGHPTLLLKNFTSTGSKKRAYLYKTVEAYDRAKVLLSRARMRFIRRQSVMSFRRSSYYFDRYFGNPSAKIPLSRVALYRSLQGRREIQPRRDIVRCMLAFIYRRAFSPNQVRLYFGGKRSNLTTEGGQNVAYTRSEIPPHGQPTRIHLSSAFFDRSLNDRAHVLIHEMSHAWAATEDYAYGDRECARLARSDPLKALANAESYALFVKNVFG